MTTELSRIWVANDSAMETALNWAREGKAAVLATVIETWGSAPRRVGAQMAICETAQMVGSVSGGCVEGDVIAEALDIMGRDAPLLLNYGVSDSDAFAVGLACGGEIRILLEPVGSALPLSILEKLVDARANRQAISYAIHLENWERIITTEVAATAQSGISPDRQLFRAIFAPPLRLAVIGAVHIAQFLVPMAQMVGFAPHIIDPREAFANAARFDASTLITQWPDQAMIDLKPDAHTAVALLTHDPKLDDPALHIALESDAFYIGALGSKRTHAKRIERLKGSGFTDAQIARIHAPIGLDIGAAGPAEIAASILAELIAAHRQAKITQAREIMAAK